MIKASALLVALAIGLLVAGVLASSLLMVYVSIGVCAVAALLLAVGILAHWSEIFGRGKARPSGMPEPWPATQVQAGTPVPAGRQAAATQATGSQTAGSPATGTAGRESRRPRREDAGRRPPVLPVEVAPAQADFPAGGGDDLWERVDEELGSAGKRDTGALSWPGTELPVLPESAEAPGQPGAAVTPPGGTGAWIWGRGAGWQPPGTQDDAWPPPAAAFAGSGDRPEPASTQADRGGPADQDADRPDHQARQPGPEEEPAAAAEPDRAADAAAPDSGDEAAEPAPESAAVKPAAWDERPRWIVSVGDATPARPVPTSAVFVPPGGDRTDKPVAGEPAASAPGTGKPSTGKPEAGKPEAGKPEARIAAVIAPASHGTPAGAPADQETASGEPAADGPATVEPAPEHADAGAPAAREDGAQEPGPGAGARQEPAADQADSTAPASEEPAAEERAAAGPSETPAPGRVEVTVVPGVARYHRSECILIRFLGAGDLEIMTRQEAEEATLVPCRACQPDQLES